MPYERYRRDLQREGFRHDPAQERAIQHLQKIYEIHAISLNEGRFVQTIFINRML